jgi:DNA-binding response OmpR family regulator
MQRVLSVGYALAPFKQRNAALSAAGLAVREAIGLVQALEMIQNDDFDVVVLGSALATDDRNEIARRARKRRQNTKLIMLYDGRIAGTEMADAIIAADDPQRVIDTVRLLAENAAGKSECA